MKHTLISTRKRNVFTFTHLYLRRTYIVIVYLCCKVKILKHHLILFYILHVHSQMVRLMDFPDFIFPLNIYFFVEITTTCQNVFKYVECNFSRNISCLKQKAYQIKFWAFEMYDNVYRLGVCNRIFNFFLFFLMLVQTQMIFSFILPCLLFHLEWNYGQTNRLPIELFSA